jgi:hypothetical protein
MGGAYSRTSQFKNLFVLKSFDICLYNFTCEVKPMGGVFTRSLKVEGKAVNRGGFYLSFSLAEAKVHVSPPSLSLQSHSPCNVGDGMPQVGQSRALD